MSRSRSVLDGGNHVGSKAISLHALEYRQEPQNSHALHHYDRSGIATTRSGGLVMGRLATIAMLQAERDLLRKEVNSWLDYSLTYVEKRFNRPSLMLVRMQPKVNRIVAIDKKIQTLQRTTIPLYCNRCRRTRDHKAVIRSTKNGLDFIVEDNDIGNNRMCPSCGNITI